MSTSRLESRATIALGRPNTVLVEAVDDGDVVYLASRARCRLAAFLALHCGAQTNARTGPFAAEITSLHRLAYFVCSRPLLSVPAYHQLLRHGLPRNPQNNSTRDADHAAGIRERLAAHKG
jgi:hypothetical protein